MNALYTVLAVITGLLLCFVAWKIGSKLLVKYRINRELAKLRIRVSALKQAHSLEDSGEIEPAQSSEEPPAQEVTSIPEVLQDEHTKYIVVLKQFSDLSSASYHESAFIFPDTYPAEVQGFDSLLKAKEKYPNADILTRDDYAAWVGSLEILRAEKPRRV